MAALSLTNGDFRQRNVTGQSAEETSDFELTDVVVNGDTHMNGNGHCNGCAELGVTNGGFDTSANGISVIKMD